MMQGASWSRSLVVRIGNRGGRPTLGTNLWVELLPYFEQDNLHNKWEYYDNRNNVAGGTNATQAQVIKILLCPSDPLPEPVMTLPVSVVFTV